MSVHVDHGDQKELFRRLIRGELDESILLIGAASGMGKTELMAQFCRIATAADVPWALHDLKVASATIPDALGLICEEWQQCSFAAYQRAVADTASVEHHVQVRGIVQIGGRQRIDIGPNISGDQELRQQRYRALTGALVEDIRTWIEPGCRVVFLIDGYDDDKLTPEYRHWVQAVLLPHVRRTPGLCAVVAGQDVPKPSAGLRDCCHAIDLPPITDADEWMPWVREQGISLDRRDVDLICHAHNGVPLDVATALQTLKTWSGVS